MGNENIYEKLFRQDSLEKKKIGRGVSNRASRKGYIRGGIKFPSDFLSTKEKRKLNGDVIVSNMYEEKYGDLKNVDLSELKMLPKVEYKNIMTYLKRNNSLDDLAKQFEMKKTSVSNLFSKLGIRVSSPKRLNSEGGGEVTLGMNISDEDVIILKKYIELTNSMLSYKEFSELPKEEQREKLKDYINSYSRKAVAEFWGKNKNHLSYLIQKLKLTGASFDYNSVKYILNNNRHLLNNANDESIEAQPTTTDLTVSDSKYDYKEQLTNTDLTTNNIKTIPIPINPITSITNSEIAVANSELTDNTELLEKMNKIIELLSIKEDESNKAKDVEVSKSSFTINGTFNKEELEKRLVNATYILDENSKYKVSLNITEL